MEIVQRELMQKTVREYLMTIMDEKDAYHAARMVTKLAPYGEGDYIHHGRWKFRDGFFPVYECTACGWTADLTEAAVEDYRFCPVCGTMMDDKEDENEI